MKKYIVLAFILLTAISCTKVEDKQVKDCGIEYNFDRVNTKGIKQSSKRIYSSYCIDLKNFVRESNVTFKKDEPTATKVKYKVYSK